MTDACVELETPTTPREILVRNVGIAPGGITISMRVENETECKRASTAVRAAVLVAVHGRR